MGRESAPRRSGAGRGDDDGVRVVADRVRPAAGGAGDAVLALVADDVVRAARLRDDRDRRRRAALATLRVALDDARWALLENA